MKYKLFTLLLAPLLLFTTVSALVPSLAARAYAVDITSSYCDPNNDGDRSDAIDPTACGVTDAQGTVAHIISVIVQTLVFIIGGLSVLMIVVGGFMYVLSGGDANNTKRAKDTIQYALIGLIVALAAQGLVSFVLSRL